MYIIKHKLRRDCNKLMIFSTLVFFLGFLRCTLGVDSRNILFIIVSQTGGTPHALQRPSITWAALKKDRENNVMAGDPYHDTLATTLKQDIEIQVLETEGRLPIVHITHEDFATPAAWTIEPLFRPIAERYNSTDFTWILFLQPSTVVRYSKLVQMFNSVDTKATWLGNKLFNTTDYSSPLAAEFALRMDIVTEFLIEIQRQKAIHPSYYNIANIEDAKLPLAWFLMSALGVNVYSDKRFCQRFTDKCATYMRKFYKCGRDVPEASIYFAVKTWSGFHNTRARVVKETWGRATSNLVFYSNETDPSLPTVEISEPNQDVGHCNKTMSILKHAMKIVENMSHVKWIVLADDDTIFGVRRLCEVLSCYRGGEYLTVLGERFVKKYKPIEIREIFPEHLAWLDFVSGGGGIVLSVGATRMLSNCECLHHLVEDDVHLSLCAQNNGIYISHSPLFHQYIPDIYHTDYLTYMEPVSFHLRVPYPWERDMPVIDGREIYETWFKEYDRPLAVRTGQPKAF